MANLCSKCKKSLGLENYGTNQNRLCYNCANEASCSVCGNKVLINDQHYDHNNLFCSTCLAEFKKSLKEIENEKIANYQNEILKKINEKEIKLPRLRTSPHNVRGVNRFIDWFFIIMISFVFLMVIFWSSSTISEFFSFATFLIYLLYHLFFNLP